MKAAVLGATGYTGMVLLRLLGSHPEISELLAVSSSRPGEPITDTDPGMAGKVLAVAGGRYVGVEAAMSQSPDVVFSALPHLTSAEVLEPFLGKVPVIDLSADFRIADEQAFEDGYGQAPPRPDLLEHVVYGLTEIYRDQIATADIIANPGCYPTCSLLPLIPFVTEGIITGPVVINALSGISGAGRKNRTNLLYVERTDNVSAYSPGRSHRHWYEIRDQIRQRGGLGLDSIYFTPHMVPVRQGMLCTTIASVARRVTETEVRECLLAAYRDSPFVRIGGMPETRHVRWSNRCDIGFQLEGEHLILFSAIDNLLKGASGQAVQNMNIRFGLEETAGLRVWGDY